MGKTHYHSKISEIEGKIPSITVLTTNAALNVVENKKPDISNLVKNTDQNTKLVKLKRKLLIMIMVNTLQLQNLIS